MEKYEGFIQESIEAMTNVCSNYSPEETNAFIQGIVMLWQCMAKMAVMELEDEGNEEDINKILEMNEWIEEILKMNCAE